MSICSFLGFCHDSVVWRVVGCFARFTGAAEAQPGPVLVLAVCATGGVRRSCRSWSEGAGLPSIGRGGTNLNLIVGYNPLISSSLSPLAPRLSAVGHSSFCLVLVEALKPRLAVCLLRDCHLLPAGLLCRGWADEAGFLPQTMLAIQRSDRRKTTRYSVDVKSTS